MGSGKQRGKTKSVLAAISLTAIMIATSFLADGFAQEPAGERETPTAAEVSVTEPRATEDEYEAEYRIGVGDVVSVSVWKDSDLSVTVPVRPDGKISVPLLGDILIAGRTPSEVGEDLTERFTEFVTAPAVSVIVEEIHSRRVFVSGQVASPGAYDIVEPTTLLQALTMAGWVTPFAHQEKVVILRRSEGGEERLQVSLKAITSGRRPGDNVLLRPGDTIVVP